MLTFLIFSINYGNHVNLLAIGGALFTEVRLVPNHMSYTLIVYKCRRANQHGIHRISSVLDSTSSLAIVEWEVGPEPVRLVGCEGGR